MANFTKNVRNGLVFDQIHLAGRFVKEHFIIAALY
jgi:hypothetical protein